MKAQLITLTSADELCNLAGELTRQSVPQLTARIAKLLNATQLVFDFKQINKVDTAGLAWICALLEQANSKNCQLSLVNLPDQLLKLAKLSGVDSFLPIK